MSHVGDMFSALSEQSWVRERAGYNEVNPSGQGNPDTLSDERNPSASSPSTRDEDLDMDGLKSDPNDNLVNANPPPSPQIHHWTEWP